jgi:hypothetical protein
MPSEPGGVEERSDFLALTGSRSFPYFLVYSRLVPAHPSLPVLQYYVRYAYDTLLEFMRANRDWAHPNLAHPPVGPP